MDLELLRDWNTHWRGGTVSPLVLRHPMPRAAVPHMLDELLFRRDSQWSLRPGPRQIGKTTSLGHVAVGLLRRGVEPRRVVIVPLDHRGVRRAANGDLQELIAACLQVIASTDGKPLFMLLDEIQELEEWDMQLKTAWDRYHDRVRITATGSSAIRLVRTTGASLANRIQITRMFTMKFREVVDAHPDRLSHMDDEYWSRLQDLARDCREAFLGPKNTLKEKLHALHEWVVARRGLADFLRAIFLEYCVWGGYPAVRPGSGRTGVHRLEFFEAALGSMVARDLPHAGVRDVIALQQMFQKLGENTGGKFVPANLARDIEVKRDTVSSWKKILEDLLVVQQLPPLKPSLQRARAKDKAYLLDPGWFAYWRNLLDHTDLVGHPEMGRLMETAIHDHLRRLRYNLFHTTTGPIGYVQDPEIDLCLRLGRRWLLVEVKTSGTRVRRLLDVGTEQDIRLVVSGRKSELSGDDLWTIPGHELALVC